MRSQGAGHTGRFDGGNVQCRVCVPGAGVEVFLGKGWGCAGSSSLKASLEPGRSGFAGVRAALCVRVRAFAGSVVGRVSVARAVALA